MVEPLQIPYLDLRKRKELKVNYSWTFDLVILAIGDMPKKFETTEGKNVFECGDYKVHAFSKS